MTIAELQQSVTALNARLRATYPLSSHREAWVLGQAVKLSEETGELAAAILTHLGLQRAEKLKNHRSERLADEVADVVITTFLVAETMGIDMESALRSKFSTLQSRHAQSSTTTSTHGTVAEQESETVPSN